MLNWFPGAQLVESIDSFVSSIECVILSFNEVKLSPRSQVTTQKGQGMSIHALRVLASRTNYDELVRRQMHHFSVISVFLAFFATNGVKNVCQ